MRKGESVLCNGNIRFISIVHFTNFPPTSTNTGDPYIPHLFVFLSLRLLPTMLYCLRNCLIEHLHSEIGLTGELAIMRKC